MFTKKLPVVSITKDKLEEAVEPQTKESTPLADLPKKKPLIKKSYIIIFLIILAISALIFGAITVSNNALNKKPLPSPTPLSSPVVIDSLASPSPTASPSAEPAIVLTDYKIQILNGSGGKNVASAVKDILTEEGFTGIDTDNAASFDYTATEISLKPDTSEQLFQTIDQALNSAYEVTRSAELLTQDSDYDVVIIVGTKK